MSPSVSKDEKLPGLLIFSSVKLGIFSSCSFQNVLKFLYFVSTSIWNCIFFCWVTLLYGGQAANQTIQA